MTTDPEAPPQAERRPTWGKGDVGVLAAQGAALLLYALVPSPLGWLPAALGFVGLAWLRLDLALLWAIASAPFYLFPKSFDPASLALGLLSAREAPLRFSLFEFTVLAATCAWLLRWLAPPPDTGRPALRLGRELGPPAAFFLAATLSLTASEFLRFSLREYRTVIIEPLLLLFLFWQARPDARALQRTMDTLLLLGLGMSVYALGHYIFVGETEATGGVRRLLAIYHSPNALALFLGRLLPLAVAYVLWAQRGRGRFALAVAAALALALALFLTYSRGAWLAVLGALLVLGWLRGGRARTLTVVAAAVAVALIVLLVPSGRLIAPATFQQRLWVWTAAWHMGLDHPILGVGLDNFLYHYPRYQLPEAWAEPDVSHPHNIWLDLWLRMGLPGLVAFIWVQWEYWRHAPRALRAPGPLQAGAAGLLASMVACLLHGLLDNSLFGIDLTALFWLTYGLTVRLSHGTPALHAP